MRISILEDDPDSWRCSSAGWRRRPRLHGYLSGRDAMKHAGRESFDLFFVLDWQVPRTCPAPNRADRGCAPNVSKTRAAYSRHGARFGAGIVFALENGADDYMEAGAAQELLPRVHALLPARIHAKRRSALLSAVRDRHCARRSARNGERIERRPRNSS